MIHTFIIDFCIVVLEKLHAVSFGSKEFCSKTSAVFRCEPHSPIILRIGQKHLSRMDCVLSKRLYWKFYLKSKIIYSSFFLADIGWDKLF